MVRIVYIGAKWCGPCRAVKPAIQDLCIKFNIPCATLDYDDDLLDHERDVISKVPTVRIYEEDRLLVEFNKDQVLQTKEWLANAVMSISTNDDDF